MDYCDRPDELAKNPGIKQELILLANGNEDAFRLMWTFWNWSQMFDDLVDGDKKVTIEDAAKYFILLVQELSFNPIFKANTHYIFSLLVSATNRWCDGDIFEQSENEFEREQSHVVRCGDLDVYLGIAYITGGWEHLRGSKWFRTYDINKIEGE